MKVENQARPDKTNKQNENIKGEKYEIVIKKGVGCFIDCIYRV